MALSMDEQRMLAEIERRLSAEDPGLAARLSSFKRPAPAVKLRSPRGRVLGSMFAIALAVVISLMVYAMIPFRTHSPSKGISSPQATGGVPASAPAKVPPRPQSSTATKTTASSAAKKTTTTATTARSKTSAPKTTDTSATTHTP